MSAQMRPAERLARYFHCTKCGAPAGSPCVKQPSGQPTMHHAARRDAAAREALSLHAGKVTVSKVTG